MVEDLGATRHRMAWEKSLTGVGLGLPGRCILITWDIQRLLLLVIVCRELKGLSGGTLRQAGLLSRTIANNSCRKNIGLSKLSPDSTLYRKVGYLFSLFFFFSYERVTMMV
jgi:hypothetical protein